MAGPATNVATIGAVYRALGARTLSIYLGTIMVGSITAGLLFDSLLPDALPDMALHLHGARWWELASTIVLCGVVAWFAFDDLRAWLSRARAEASEKTNLEVGVDGMTCNGCRTRLEKALLGTPGVDAAVVTLEPGSAKVWGSLDDQSLREAVVAAGYTPRDEASDQAEPAEVTAPPVVSIGGR
jgi:copper chaperone CopZ